MRRVSGTPKSASVLTVLNLKGGVGKTHATWLLAAVAEELSLRILLIDTDPQGNLSNSFARDRGDSPGVAQLLDPSQEPDAMGLVRRTAYPNIDIIPSSPQVAQFDEADQKKWEKADLQFSFRDAITDLRLLYDFIVFDCPPRLSLASFAALCASDGVIVPLEAADWGAQGIMQVTEAIEYVKERFNSNLRLLGYLVSRFKPGRTYQQTYLSSLREHFGETVFDVVVPDAAHYERSVTDAVPITRHAPKSHAAKIARQFFSEVCARLESVGGRQQSPRSVRPNRRKAALSAA
jgi:chromosome partitioning protein